MPNSTGYIAQVVGPVVDVHFDISARNAESELPRISDALQVKRPDGRNTGVKTKCVYVYNGV